MKSIVYIILVAGLIQAVCVGDEELLRQAWTFRPGEKDTLLASATARFEALVRRWPGSPQSPQQARADPDVQWLLEQQAATYLVVDAGLAQETRGARRSALLFLAGRLHYGTLGQYMPGLLSASTTNEERLEVLQCMAALQDLRSLQALETFLTQQSAGVSEELLVEAGRGLGISGRPDYLTAISAVRKRVTSPAARFELAKSACRCGDASAAADVACFLDAPETPAEMKSKAIQFLCDNFSDHSLAGLTRFACTTEDQQLAVAATWAIINGTRYGRTIPAGPAYAEAAAGAGPAAEPAGGQPGGADGPEAGKVLPGLPPDVSRLSQDERRQLIEKITQWWLEEGRALKEKNTRSSDVS
jgi:hypothetical protein